MAAIPAAPAAVVLPAAAADVASKWDVVQDSTTVGAQAVVDAASKYRQVTVNTPFMLLDGKRCKLRNIAAVPKKTDQHFKRI